MSMERCLVLSKVKAITFLFFILYGILIGLLIFYLGDNLTSYILALILCLIPLIFINPNVGMVLFIFSLPITTQKLTFNAGFHLNISYIFFAVTLISWLFHKGFKMELIFKKAPLAIPLFSFLLIAAVSAFQSAYVTDIGNVLFGAIRNYPWIKSLGRVFLLCFMVAIFYFIINFIETKRIHKRILTVLFLSTMFVSLTGLYGIVRFYLGKPRDFFGMELVAQYSTYFPRAQAFFPEPTVLGLYLILSYPIFLLLFISKDYLLSKHLHLMGLILNLAVIILTFSRSAWLALLIIFLLFLLIKKRVIMPILFSRKMILIYLMVITIFLIFHDPFKARIQKMIIEPITGIMDIHSTRFFSTKLRYIGYLAALNMIRQHPFLGVGLENFHFHSGGYNVIEMGYPPGFLYYPVSIDNLILKIFCEMGLLGLGISIWLLFSILHLFYFTFKNSRATNQYIYNIILGGFFGFVGFLIQSLFFVNLTFVYPWAFFGLVFAATGLGGKDAK